MKSTEGEISYSVTRCRHSFFWIFWIACLLAWYLVMVVVTIFQVILFVLFVMWWKKKIHNYKNASCWLIQFEFNLNLVCVDLNYYYLTNVTRDETMKVMKLFVCLFFFLLNLLLKFFNYICLLQFTLIGDKFCVNKKWTSWNKFALTTINMIIQW